MIKGNDNGATVDVWVVLRQGRPILRSVAPSMMEAITLAVCPQGWADRQLALHERGQRLRWWLQARRLHGAAVGQVQLVLPAEEWPAISDIQQQLAWQDAEEKTQQQASATDGATDGAELPRGITLAEAGRMLQEARQGMWRPAHDAGQQLAAGALALQAELPAARQQAESCRDCGALVLPGLADDNVPEDEQCQYCDRQLAAQLGQDGAA